VQSSLRAGNEELSSPRSSCLAQTKRSTSLSLVPSVGSDVLTLASNSFSAATLSAFASSWSAAAFSSSHLNASMAALAQRELPLRRENGGGDASGVGTFWNAGNAAGLERFGTEHRFGTPLRGVPKLLLPRERLRGLGTFDEPRINCFYNSLALAARESLCTSYLEHGCFVCCNLLDCRCNDVGLSPPAPPCCPSPQLCAADNLMLQHPSNLLRQDEWLGLVPWCEHCSRFRVVRHGGGL